MTMKKLLWMALLLMLGLSTFSMPAMATDPPEGGGTEQTVSLDDWGLSKLSCWFFSLKPARKIDTRACNP